MTKFAEEAQKIIDRLNAQNARFEKTLKECSDDIDRKFAAADRAIADGLREVREEGKELGVLRKSEEKRLRRLERSFRPWWKFWG
jgi:hypothetical protein